MHKLRVFLALIFGILIVAGLMTRYRQHPDRQIVVDPLQPVWNKISVLADRIWWKTVPPSSPEKTPTWTEKPGLGSWVFAVEGQLHPEFLTGQIQVADLLDITKDSPTFGDKNASLVLLQWCDFWSPYCIESYEKWTLFEYINAFPKELSYQLKWFPRDTKETTVLQHKATLCAESLTTKEIFLSFYFNIYQARGELSKEDLLTLAKKLDIQGFPECLATKSIVALQQEMKRGRALFAFSSLPANVVLSKQTGAYVLIPWLYETQDVLQAIQRLLDNQ